MFAAIREPAVTAPWFFRLAAIGVLATLVLMLITIRLAMSFTLSACGRKSGLELPPRATAQPEQQQQAQQQPAVFGAPEDDQGPVAPQGQRKGFPLDWLLN